MFGTLRLVVFFFLLAGVSWAYPETPAPSSEPLGRIETDHFTVIHQESLAETAPLVAAYCEEAYRVLVPVLGWAPREKTKVIYIDAHDTHNGWATPSPHNVISLYAAGSEPWSSIYETGDYLRRTIYHELTHVLSMDMRYGYSAFFSSIFGKGAGEYGAIGLVLSFFSNSPIVFTPRWFLEGLSIWSETEFTPPGRGRSTYVDMIFRTAVRDGNLIPFSEWDLSLPRWPYGMCAYLYGMKFFEQLYQTGPGPNPVGSLTQDSARRFAFGLNAAVYDLTGRNVDELAADALAAETARQKMKLARLRTVPVTPAVRETPRGLNVQAPVFIGDRIFFGGREEERRSGLYVLAADDARPARLFPWQGSFAPAGLSPAQNGKYLFYNQLQVLDGENYWYEVKRLNLQTWREDLVDNQGRFRAVSASPDGRRLAAASQRAGKSGLFILDLDERGRIVKEQELLAVPWQDDLAGPTFAPDGARIAFVQADRAKYKLLVYDLESGALTLVRESAARIMGPAWHPLQNILVYASDENGVFNLHQVAAEPLGEVRALTNVTGGLFQPCFSPDGTKLAAVGVDGFGPHLVVIPYRPEALAGRALPGVGPDWPSGKIQAWLRAGGLDPVARPRVDQTASTAYNSLTGIRFDYWSPWIQTSSRGLMGGAAASLSDPSGFQEINVSAGYETYYRTGLGSLHYFYRGLYPEFHLWGVRSQDSYHRLLVETATRDRFDLELETNRYGGAVDIPMVKRDWRLSLLVGAEFVDTGYIRQNRDDWRKRRLAQYPSDEDEGLGFVGLVYRDGTAFGRSFSVEDGRRVSVTAEGADESIAGGVTRGRILAEWDEYISLPWLKNHVLKLSGAYGSGNGDRTAQGLFGLGGNGSILADSIPGAPGTLTLRGYRENFQTGREIVRAGAAYRFPLFGFQRGREGGFPFYANQIFGEFFYEGGRTYDPVGAGDDLGWLNSCGAEVNFSMTVFRYLAFAPGLGVAAAPDRIRKGRDEGVIIPYLSIKGWVSF
ncbi:MAG: hypothetical protein V1816_22945 [Pseudomonadota bacterium]